MRRITFSIALLGIISCVQKNKIPEDILSQEKMRQIMWDLIRTDAYVSDFLSRDSTINLDESRLKLYEQVYRLHTINRETFKKSLTFYQSRPDLLKIITDSLRVDEKKATEEQHNNKPLPADTILSKPKKIFKNKE